MNFKVGDRVLVVRPPEFKIQYGPQTTSELTRVFGKLGTVRSVRTFDIIVELDGFNCDESFTNIKALPTDENRGCFCFLSGEIELLPEGMVIVE